MNLQLASINSGSNANCYYIGNDKEAVLIDAGLSCRETEKRMKRLELDIQKVKAIFISHEHADHIAGLEVLSKKHQLPVYITPRTLANSNLKLETHLIHSFNKNKAVNIGDLEILPFTKSHDADDPHSFTISAYGLNVGVITDIGYACKQVLKHFANCHAVFLESNYCEEMLMNGGYPYHLKQRISGDEGHLSNKQALDLFLNYKAPHLQLLLLSHLSKNNNKPEVAEALFAPHAGHVQIVVASRDKETELFTIKNSGFAFKPRKHTQKKNQFQLSLFDGGI
ncbi:MBL fold metallo-hydrolase [Lacibacter sp. MH-610]|uniref:MBL fold metallo-hydrolase n=1 Tax=Lacibacter sp. MH-610 TaxID=3020883 RepID=UPI003891602D